MARLIEYRVINDEIPSSLKIVRIEKQPRISKLHDHTRRIHPWKSVPLKRREKKNLLFRSRFSPLLEIRSLLFYKFPLSFFFRRMKMKRQYLSMNKRGEVVKGDKKKKKRKKNTTPDTLSSILLPRVVQVECHSVQTYPLPLPRHWARLGIVQPEA